MRTIYDITHMVAPDLVVWPGDTPVQMTPTREVGKGSRASVSCITLSSHAGTHVDAPAHFLESGATVETLALETLIGPALVVDVNANEISAQVLDALSIPSTYTRLIFKTSNTDRWTGKEPFFKDYVGVTESGAKWLVDRGITLAGLDYLSIAAHPHILEVHHLLLGAGVVLLETLNLQGVPAGAYELVCLPLKLQGIDGSPVRAVLIKKEDSHVAQ